MGHVCHVRAPVVDVNNCNITGSEAWISAEKAPWAYRSRSECCLPVILLQAIVKDIDCDAPFAAYYDEGDGLGCKSCEPGTLFVKNSTTNTIENGDAIQRCVPCPDGAKICNATAVEMMPGYLARKHRCKNKLSAFCIFCSPKCFGHSLHQTILREACGESMHGPHDCVNRGRMVELSNLSRSFHCPNQLACFGGAVSSNVLTLMCAGGAINTHLQKISKNHKTGNISTWKLKHPRVKQPLFMCQD